MVKNTKHLSRIIADELAKTKYGQSPKSLYEPIDYIMALEGKRLRPMLVLLSYGLFKDDPKSIIRQALAIEVFHNFTLVHDDIMDEAPLRRGNKTVHQKWNVNTAILSGDVMLVKAHEMLISEDVQATIKALQAFGLCAREVCEGQQLDMIFENQKNVNEADYIEMIRLKTAVLLGLSLEMGAILAGADEKDRTALRKFGEHIGIGFQLKDDLLDVYADQKKFGKQIGGDILSNKKTFLLITALEKANSTQKKKLNTWLSREIFDPAEKIKAITDIYDALEIKTLTEEKMNYYFDLAFQYLRKVTASLHSKAVLKEFVQSLAGRVQ